MTKFRKILIVVILVAFGLGTFLFVRKQRQKEAPPPPSLQSEFPGTFQIEAKFGQKDFNFPSELPILKKQTFILSSDNMKKIAQGLGFTQEPIKAEDTLEGTTYIYQKGNSTLTFVPQKGKIDYQLSSLPQAINKQISDDGFINLASVFLVNNNFSTKDEIKFSSISYLTAGPSQGFLPADRNSATIFQINFIPGKGDIPILTLDPKNTPIYVRILSDGSVYSVSISKFNALESETKYGLKNYKEVLASLQKSTLVSLDNGNIPLSALDAQAIKSVSVSSIKLFYLLDPSDTLQPVYLLEGTGQVSGKANDVSASFYLPAFR